MRAFIVLSLVAVACAQHNHQSEENSVGIDGGFNGHVGEGFNGGSESNDALSFAPQAGLNSQFYTYTADDNDFNDATEAQRAAQSVRQAARVVFIKGPSNKGLEDALLNLGKQSAAQTAIYVLNKEADISGLANKLNSANKNSNNQPEVHFVKYRTPEDAENAQRAIQGQYDALGGKSRNINGGVAPILNFASQTPAASAPSHFNLPESILRQFRH